jgi:hypothetical protein
MLNKLTNIIHDTPQLSSLTARARRHPNLGAIRGSYHHRRLVPLRKIAYPSDDRLGWSRADFADFLFGIPRFL